MTLIEFTVIAGIFLGSLTGAVWGFVSGGIGWAVMGLAGGVVLGPIALALLFTLMVLVTEVPLFLLRGLRGRRPPERP
ncbi:hypothetical protein JYK02_36925 [Corallococcus macrosporus]|uniref:Major facilitator superfamily (MFS) profile domain-containing protein n=1 Tax=Corallococcus macrosporus TaxID=35 RepID=A0ABS3DP49_9BACT|nr:hypothetical protein [Corallococcus macrosporus]MBN8233113.1 hypothetical protein [Corallococcus macrosporus]